MIRRLDAESVLLLDATVVCSSPADIVVALMQVHATRISITLTENLIVIADNSVGVADVKAALEGSKLLTSLMAVSQLTVTSKSASRLVDHHAYSIDNSMNVRKSVEHSFAPSGTSIAIRNLFYNVPVRRGAMPELVQKALAAAKQIITQRIQVAFTLNGTTYPARTKLEDRIADVYGFERKDIACFERGAFRLWVLRRRVRFDVITIGRIVDSDFKKIKADGHETILAVEQRCHERCHDKIVQAPHQDAANATVLLARYSESVFSKQLQMTQRPVERLPAAVMFELKSMHLSAAEVIGQFADSFVLVRVERVNVFIIDQHAADERIKLEELQGQMASLSGLFEATPMDKPAASFGDYNSYNIRIEGGRLTSLPRLLSSKNVTLPDLSVMDSYIDELLRSRACHAAVRAGDRLDQAQMRAIVQGLAECRLPWQCAHGRPTVQGLAQFSAPEG